MSFHQSQEMCAQMKTAGSSCEVYAVEGAPHATMFWEGHPEWLGYKQKVPAWLKQAMN